MGVSSNAVIQYFLYKERRERLSFSNNLKTPKVSDFIPKFTIGIARLKHKILTSPASSFQLEISQVRRL